MRTGKVFLTLVAVLAMAGAAGAQTIWQIGYANGAVNPIIGGGEYPANEIWEPILPYEIGSDDDPINQPSAFGYIGTDNVCAFVTDGRPCTDTTASLFIKFSSPCGYENVELVYARYGSEKDELFVDGVSKGLVGPGPGEGNYATYNFDLGTLSPGLHTIKINYAGEGSNNGHYVDYIALTGDSSDCTRELDLCAGQNDEIGVVGVTNDDTNLYVTFNTFGDWRIEETHVAVGTIPTNKKGNPVPGQFPYACTELGDMAQSCTATIPLDGFCAGQDVTIAAHAAVVEVGGDGCEGEIFWASTVFDLDQGTLKNGNPVLDTRDDPESVFLPDGIDQNGNAIEGNFYSLGFDLLDDSYADGWLTVGFGAPVYNGPGPDVVVQEVTNGRASYKLERAEVFGVDNGTDYIAGVVTNKDVPDGLGSVELPDVKSTYEYVKLLDATDPSLHNATADGYDVDAIGACWLFYGEETAWGDGCEGERISEQGNWGTQFEYTVNYLAPTCGE